MNTISSAIAIITLVLLSGCRSESAVSKEGEGTVDRAVDFQIAVRSNPYGQGDSLNEGEFLVVSSNVLPIHSTGGPGHVVCNHDGVIMELQWEGVRLFQTRIDQHHSPDTRIAFDNCRFVIKNQLVYPDGQSHRLGSAVRDSLNLNTEFDFMFSPLTFSSGVEEKEHALVIRGRLLPQAKPAKPLTIPKMSGAITENAG